MRRAIVTVVLIAVALTGFATGGDAQEHPQRLREMLLTLENRQVSVDFRDKPLAEVLKFFSTFSGVSLIVSPKLQAVAAERDLDITLTLQNVSVKTCLQIIIQLKELASVYRNGVIQITTKQDARGKPTLRIYSIGDLTMKIRDFPGPDLILRPAGSEFEGVFGGEEEGKEHSFADPEFIQDLVTENTGEGTWDDDGVRIRVTERHLFVRQYAPVHREIARLLGLLRGYR